jgi:hypothetical protein
MLKAALTIRTTTTPPKHKTLLAPRFVVPEQTLARHKAVKVVKFQVGALVTCKRRFLLVSQLTIAVKSLARLKGDHLKARIASKDMLHPQATILVIFTI